MKLSIDVGGTFTDLVPIDDTSGTLVDTTPRCEESATAMSMAESRPAYVTLRRHRLRLRRHRPQRGPGESNARMASESRKAAVAVIGAGISGISTAYCERVWRG